MPGDYFAILRQPRQPALDPEDLKGQFLGLSGEMHPDKAGEGKKSEAAAQFAELNAAHHCLRDTRARLEHLLELEGMPKAPHVQSAPPEAMEFFAPVAQLTRQADEFLAAKRKAASPILQAQLFEEGLGWTDQLQGLQGRLRERIQALESEIGSMNEAWRKAPSPGDPRRKEALPLARLQEIAAALGFLQRWNAQLQERIATIAF